MTGNPIRLRYSGFLLFTFRLISVGTGLLFTLMVTRTITPEEYGIYNNLNDILLYFTLASQIIPFWVTRFIARGHPNSSKTGLMVNTSIALASAIIYLITISKILDAFQVSEKYLLLYAVGVFLIIERYLQAIFEAILYPKRPEIIGFGLLVSEVSKVTLGFILIMSLKMGLIGALASIIIAFLIQISFYFKKTFHELHGKIEWNYTKEWLKASLLNIYGIICMRILALPNLFLFIFSGEVARAYYGASSAIASIVGYSSSLSFALYPRLLSKINPKDVSLSIKMVSLFAIPMCMGAIALSEQLLSILNPLYAVAKPVLILMAINALMTSISSIFDSVIRGTEKMDVEAKISFRDLVKSKIFLSITFSYIRAAAFVPLTYIILSPSTLDALASALWLTSIGLASALPVVAAKYFLAQKCLKFDIPWISIGKYLATSLVMALVLHLIPTPARLSTTLLKVAIGAATYFFILLLIDEDTREIVRETKKFASREILNK